jgi:hypothetical protein
VTSMMPDRSWVMQPRSRPTPRWSRWPSN